jgi:hypothetical protein
VCKSERKRERERERERERARERERREKEGHSDGTDVDGKRRVHRQRKEAERLAVHARTHVDAGDATRHDGACDQRRDTTLGHTVDST